jgi:prepilin-type N-terminal cleavage/methylation domain-containing protein
MGRRRPVRGGGPGGFTLLELLLVLFLLGLLGGLVLPSLHGPLESARLRAGGADVRTALSQARTLAVRDGAERAVSFDLSRGAYAVPGEEGSRSLPEGIRFASLRVRGAAPEAAPAVRFFPDGGGEEAEILLVSPSGGRLVLRVEPLTGIAGVGS